MILELSEKGQTLFDLLICIPPKMEEAERFLQEEKLSVEEITRVGIRYADDCFCDLGDHIAMLNPEVDYDLRGIEIPDGIMSGLNSTYLYEIVALLLKYGLDPNMLITTSNCEYNIMAELQYVDNEYVAADTMVLLSEHGADPNMVVDGETVYEKVDFDMWFDAVEQELRWRYDSLVHFWMVLIGCGGNYHADTVKVFREYESDHLFDLKKLKNHRNYYFGVTAGRVIHIYDKATLWEVVRFE